MSTLKVNQIENRTGTGDITLPTGNRIVATDADSFVQPVYSGQVLQAQAVQSRAIGGHIAVTSTSFTNLPLTIDITVRSGSSSNEVRFRSDMQYGLANVLITNLLFSTNGGASYTELTPVSPYPYNWMYNNLNWQPAENIFLHTHGQPAGTTIRYLLQYKNYSSTATNYLVHSEMGYGWRVMEIAG